MAFDYVVSLELTGRPCIVSGGGPLAAERVQGLLASRAEVTVITPDPAPGVVVGGVTHIPRTAVPADLRGAFLAIVTREDGAPVEELWRAAEQHGVLLSALDDVAHCHFGAVSTIRRGALSVTISTAGRAPALAKRLRQLLEPTIDHDVGRLVELLHEARRLVLPRRAGFDEWSAGWEAALADLDHLLSLVRDGSDEEVVRHVHAHLASVGTPPAEVVA